MKNKTKTYILLAFVLGIWSVIGFKIISTINPDTPEAIPQNTTALFNPKTKAEAYTFSVQTANRDPFLGTLYTKSKLKKTKAVKLKETLVWVPITYHGTIAKQQSKTQIFVLTINGQQYLMRLGQEINNIKLLKATTKNILVTYKGEKKTIIKS